MKSILDILEKHKIKATFFIIGECLEKNSDLRKKAINQGHEICCHTYAHTYLNDSYSQDNRFTKMFRTSKYKDEYLKKYPIRVKNLLGDDYLKELKNHSPNFPDEIDSLDLLKTEILMREKEVEKILGKDYLQKMKKNHPFFRFPGGHGIKDEKYLNLLKELGYISIGWSYEERENTGNGIKDGQIALYHFNPNDSGKLEGYLQNIQQKKKSISDMLKLSDN